MNDPFGEAAKDLSEQSRYACWELAKYLFTANTGAAAGMLLALRSTPGSMPVLISLGCFCFGTACVLTSIFSGTVHAVELSEGFQNDCLARMPEAQIKARHEERCNERKIKVIQKGAKWSCCSLVVGGVIAAFAFFQGVTPASDQKTNSITNVTVTNNPAISLVVTSALPVYFSALATNAPAKPIQSPAN